MPRVILSMNREGMKALLHDSGVKADLERRARRVESAYQPPAGVSAPSTRVEQTHEAGGWGRVLTRVEVEYPAAPWCESQSGRLAQALDDGIGG